MKKIIKLHNSLSGQKQIFTPKTEGLVNLYCCGPTVYDYAHIGNFRSFLMADLLTRTLEYAGYEVKKIQNITDVGHLTNDDLADANGDDKVAKKAKAEGKTAWDIAEYYTKAFIEDEEILRIAKPSQRPKATDYIAEQIDMIETLISQKFAYEVNGSVYFKTAKFKDYGKLSKNKLADLQAGARVEINNEKEDPLDFALWKRAEPSHLMQWKSPWGQGFPGWHIECSAMSQTLLPEGTDIHTGGEDNAFPHHECEIAQNECSSGYHIPYWLHAKHLLVDGKKMSKSKGNFFTIRDLIAQNYKGEEIRYALLAAHYRSALNFTQDSLIQARNSIARIQEAHRLIENLCEAEPEEKNRKFEKVETARTNFCDALCDDLNVAEALAVVFDLVAEGLKMRDENTLTADQALLIVEFLEQDFNQIFAVLNFDTNELSHEIEILLQKRAKARSEKDFAESDRLRDEIKKLGWEVKDEADGQSVKPL